MASTEFLQSKWADTEDGRFTHPKFSSMEWWEGLKYIIDTVQPIYKFLRFADQDKKGPKKGDPKRRKGKETAKPVSSDTETDDGKGERSPLYQESVRG